MERRSKAVYVGRPKGRSDFVDTDGDGLGDLARKDLQFIRVLKDGVLVEYRGGSRVVISGSFLEVLVPETAVWEGTRSIYPYVFRSDSDWSVDLCAEVPEGYRIAGTWGADGGLDAEAQCGQTEIAAGETRVLAFEVVETGSTEPSLTARLSASHSPARSTVRRIRTSDIRSRTLESKLAEALARASQRSP